MRTKNNILKNNDKRYFYCASSYTNSCNEIFKDNHSLYNTRVLINIALCTFKFMWSP